MAKSQFRLLTTRRFLPLFMTQALGLFNDHLFKKALVVFITFNLVANTKNAQLLINLAAGLYGLPFLFFSAMAGQLADKYNRARIAQIIKLIEIGLMLLVWLGFYSHNIPLLLGLIFLLGMHSTFFGPIKFSSLPLLLTSQELLGGNGLIEASAVLAALIGAIIGTVLGWSTYGAIFVAQIGLLLAIFGWYNSLFIPSIPLADPTLKMNRNFIAETWHNVMFVRHMPHILITMFAISWFILVSYAIVTQFPIFAKAVVHGNQNETALFLILFAIGIAVGSLICNRLCKGQVHARFVPAAAIAMAIFTFDLAWASHLAPTLLAKSTGMKFFLALPISKRICADLFLLAVASGIYIVPLYALLQAQSDSTHLSRVMACNNIFASFFGVIAAIVVMLMVAIGFNMVQILLTFGMLDLAVAIGIHRSLAKLKQTIV